MRLLEAVNAYVEGRRTFGAAYPDGSPTLDALCRYAGNIPLQSIRERQLAAFLDGPKIKESTWQNKYRRLRHFFLFWLARNAISASPMPPQRPLVQSSFTPYVYSRSEIHRLLSMVRLAQKNGNCKIDPRVVRAVILLLYGTGALLSEALSLRREDLDFRRHTITFRSSRPHRARTIPMCPDLYNVLRKYVVATRQDAGQIPYLFFRRNGEAITGYQMETTFRRLRQVAGVKRRDGAGYQPRLHDLRNTFAIHRIDAWIKHGADLNRMLPALSVYMGRHSLSSSDRYLTLSPERFRAQLNKLSPRRSKRHWRDNARLMRFLAEL